MTFPTDDIQTGPRSWGRRPATVGVILHTTEYSGYNGAAPYDRATAVRCARDQSARTLTGGWKQPGSYNFIVYDRNSPGARGGALLTVPYLEASGGINPASPAWAPERFPWLRELLGPKAYADPTMYHLQICFSGKAADLSAGRYPANMIDTAARIINWAEDSDWANDNLVVSRHGDWQTNRTDPGDGVLQRVLARCAELRRQAKPAPAPEPPVVDVYVPPAIDHAGERSAFGTLYPTYVHSDGQALEWVNRNIRRLIESGHLKLS